MEVGRFIPFCFHTFSHFHSFTFTSLHSSPSFHSIPRAIRNNNKHQTIKRCVSFLMSMDPILLSPVLTHSQTINCTLVTKGGPCPIKQVLPPLPPQTGFNSGTNSYPPRLISFRFSLFSFLFVASSRSPLLFLASFLTHITFSFSPSLTTHIPLYNPQSTQINKQQTLANSKH